MGRMVSTGRRYNNQTEPEPPTDPDDAERAGDTTISLRPQEGGAATTWTRGRSRDGGLRAVLQGEERTGTVRRHLCKYTLIAAVKMRQVKEKQRRIFLPSWNRY